MNPGGGACSEPRSRHWTPAWKIERDSVSKKKRELGFLVWGRAGFKWCLSPFLSPCPALSL